jgi:hypothetical protein
MPFLLAGIFVRHIEVVDTKARIEKIAEAFHRLPRKASP